MCQCHSFSHLKSTLVSFLDTVLLSNFFVLTRLNGSLFPVLLGFIKAFVCWLSGGRSWLLRVCADKRAWNLRKGRRIQLIAFHLRYSRALSAESKLIFNSPAQVTIDLDRLTKIIALKKRIPLDSEAFGVLKTALQHILQVEKLIDHVLKRARTPFNQSEHLHLLQSLWNNLHHRQDSSDDSKKLPSMPSIPDERWQELGFQGKNPGTDFRGMGLLGLDQLLAYTQIAPKSAHNLWQQSQLGSAWFTFATVGINITALLYALLISHTADEFFFTQSSSDGLVAFNHAYQLVFEKFGQYWVSEDAKDVMDFGRIFAKLKLDIETNLENFGSFFPDNK